MIDVVGRLVLKLGDPLALVNLSIPTGLRIPSKVQNPTLKNELEAKNSLRYVCAFLSLLNRTGFHPAEFRDITGVYELTTRKNR